MDGCGYYSQFGVGSFILFPTFTKRFTALVSPKTWQFFWVHFEPSLQLAKL
jgi:hypothetical protein